jgi:hypothetical protein
MISVCKRFIVVSMLGIVIIATLASGTGFATQAADSDSDSGYVVETSDGDEYCMQPIRNEGNVSQFYGYNTDARDSRGGDTSFEQAKTASLLLYEDTQTGNLSLVFLHGSANESNLRQANYDLSGFEGTEWLVKDDPESFTYDSYAYEDGAIAGVQWQWQSGTDGGAIGSLGSPFSVTVDATVQEVGTWRLIDGNSSTLGTVPVGGDVQISTPSDGDGPCSEGGNNQGGDENGSDSSSQLPLIAIAIVAIGIVGFGGWYLRN